MSSATAPLDDENLLPEILLRIPPQPSCLPRASAVSKRWRRLVSGPGFLPRYRRHHRRNPPLLGCFVNDPPGISYVPTMDPPDRVPARRFCSQLDDGGLFDIINCRHGLVLMSDASRKDLLVWDPVTGEQHRIALHGDVNPSNGAVLRAAGGDVHHFQVVLVEAAGDDDGLPGACVYSSETGEWGDHISASIQSETYTSGASTVFSDMQPAVLVGNSLHWLLRLTSGWIAILEFDTETQSLAVMELPVDMFEMNQQFSVVRTNAGGLGLLFVSDFIAKFWEREMDCDGGASWVWRRMIHLGKLLFEDSEERGYQFILGYAEENNVVFLSEVDGVVMVQLESLKFKKIRETHNALFHHPFESVYTAGIGIGGEHDGAELVHNA